MPVLSKKKKKKLTRFFFLFPFSTLLLFMSTNIANLFYVCYLPLSYNQKLNNNKTGI